MALPDGGASLPIICLQSASQGVLAAGAEATVTINLPNGLVVPARGGLPFGPWAIATVMPSSLETNVQYQCEMNEPVAGQTSVQAKVRNVGTVNGSAASWCVNVMLLGGGQALGI